MGSLLAEEPVTQPLKALAEPGPDQTKASG